MWRSCSNPVHIDNQYRRNSRPCFGMLEAKALVLVQRFASLANWCDVHAGSEFTSFTSTEKRAHAHMQVSSSDPCERTILSTVSVFAKGQNDEESLLRNVEGWKSGSFPGTSTFVWRRFFDRWCCCLTASRNPFASCTRNQVTCSSSVEKMSRASNNWCNWCHAGRTNTCTSSMSFQSCQWCGVHAASQFTSITSTEQRARTHAGVKQWPLWKSHSLHMFAKGQNDEESLLRNVEGWKSWSFPGTSTFAWRRFLGCWCCCVTASRNPVATRNHVPLLVSGKNEESIEHILPC